MSLFLYKEDYFLVHLISLNTFRADLGYAKLLEVKAAKFYSTFTIQRAACDWAIRITRVSNDPDNEFVRNIILPYAADVRQNITSK